MTIQKLANDIDEIFMKIPRVSCLLKQHMHLHTAKKKHVITIINHLIGFLKNTSNNIIKQDVLKQFIFKSTALNIINIIMYP